METPNMISENRSAEIKAAKKANAEKLISGFFASAKEHHRNLYANIPKRYQNGWLKSFLGISSKRGAIQAKCYECVGYEAVQENVGGCTARACPLWPFRPLQKSAAAKALKGAK
jgi:hypothetical protein